MQKLLCIVTMMITIVGYSQDFNSLRKKAKDLDLPIVLIFSGSDWCAPCKKMERDVFGTVLFEQTNEVNWVVYRADFPRKNQQAREVVATNQELAEKYNPRGVFPLVVLMNAEGEVLKTFGYEKIDVQSYIEKLKRNL